MQYFRIWILFKGYVIIRAEGNSIEKFINICMHRKISFVDIQRHDGYIIYKMLADEFKNVRGVAKKTCCKLKILDKKGLIFFLRKYRKRKSFLAGSMIFIAVFLLLWSYVWDIEVLGYPREKEILDYLNRSNIKIGSMKYGIDVDKLEYCLITDFKDISWVDVRVKGTRLVIRLSCRRKVPDIIDNDVPCDVVAKRDGIVTKVLVKNGIENVKVGDAVVAGDVLISGMVLTEGSDNVKMIHAIGMVLAKTIYTEREEVRCIATNKVYTKKVYKEYRVRLLGKELFKLKYGSGTGKYDENSNFKKVRLFKNFVVPLEIEQYKREYYKESQEVITMELAKKQAIDLAKDKILKCIPKSSTIIGHHVDCYEYRDKIFVNVIVEASEDIGREKLIK